MSDEQATPERGDLYALRREMRQTADVASAAADAFGAAFDADLALMHTSGVKNLDDAMRWNEVYEIGYQQWLFDHGHGDEVEEWAKQHMTPKWVE